MAFSNGDVLTPADLRKIEACLPESPDQTPEQIWRAIEVHQVVPRREAYDMLELQLFRKAMSEHRTVRKAAKALGIAHSSVVRKLMKLGITRTGKPEAPRAPQMSDRDDAE